MTASIIISNGFGMIKQKEYSFKSRTRMSDLHVGGTIRVFKNRPIPDLTSEIGMFVGPIIPEN